MYSQRISLDELNFTAKGLLVKMYTMDHAVHVASARFRQIGTTNH